MANKEHLDLLLLDVAEWNNQRKAAFMAHLEQPNECSAAPSRETIHQSAISQTIEKMGRFNITAKHSNFSFPGLSGKAQLRDRRRRDRRSPSLILPDFRRPDLRDADFKYKNLEGADLSDTHLIGADFCKANLTRANLKGANLLGVTLTGACLTHTDLRGADIIQADLSKADLSGANLERANLSGTNLTDAVLSGANLKITDIIGANLERANLSHTDLTDADLTDANLSGANLSDAVLHQTNGLILDSAKVRNAQFSSRSPDPWSVLRRTYTGPKFTFNLLALIAFAAPYFIKAAFWSSTNRMQTQTQAMLETMSEKAIDQGLDANTIKSIGLSTESEKLALCLSEQCIESPVWKLLLGMDQGGLFWLLPATLIIYNAMRGVLTYVVAPMRDEEERSGWSPKWKGEKWWQGYRILYWVHQGVFAVGFIALAAFLVNAFYWLTQSVFLPG